MVRAAKGTRTPLLIRCPLLRAACQLMAYLNNFTLSTFVPLIKEHFQRQVARYIAYSTPSNAERNNLVGCLLTPPLLYVGRCP